MQWALHRRPGIDQVFEHESPTLVTLFELAYLPSANLNNHRSLYLNNADPSERRLNFKHRTLLLYSFLAIAWSSYCSLLIKTYSVGYG